MKIAMFFAAAITLSHMLNAQTPNQDLWLAIQQGNTGLVQQLATRKDINLNKPSGAHDYTPLMQAVVSLGQAMVDAEHEKESLANKTTYYHSLSRLWQICYLLALPIAVTQAFSNSIQSGARTVLHDNSLSEQEKASAIALLGVFNVAQKLGGVGMATMVALLSPVCAPYFLKLCYDSLRSLSTKIEWLNTVRVQKNIVELLLKQKPDLSVKDKYGNTAADLLTCYKSQIHSNNHRLLLATLELALTS